MNGILTNIFIIYHSLGLKVFFIVVDCGFTRKLCVVKPRSSMTSFTSCRKWNAENSELMSFVMVLNNCGKLLPSATVFSARLFKILMHSKILLERNLQENYNSFVIAILGGVPLVSHVIITLDLRSPKFVRQFLQFDSVDSSFQPVFALLEMVYSHSLPCVRLDIEPAMPLTPTYTSIQLRMTTMNLL